ncbi:HSP20-like chaperone protein [Actinidia chinensis var. chinensis]|uniref:HSP20-like chaperone protein n=1 Tax=Actinidia chinensis var. chinensis TaxID=1590841 RepID=A0A2R6QNN4_ACTCC|nr:HSP20-like chaperone protein [Actinidia chinensis var. chinensis]
MASKAVMSAPTFLTKLVRLNAHHFHPHASPFSFTTRMFSTGPPLRNPKHNDPNPFLRAGELGPCRVEKTENECFMRVDVPGVAEEEMKVWTESGFVYFHAQGSKIPEYNYDGRVFGGSIKFDPTRFDSNGVKAEVKNGVLCLSVPRLKD